MRKKVGWTNIVATNRKSDLTTKVMIVYTKEHAGHLIGELHKFLCEVIRLSEWIFFSFGDKQKHALKGIFNIQNTQLNKRDSYCFIF